ncbi:MULTISPECIES: flagellar hook-associated protein FlgL [Rheinheimera]|jgi:flagellar hook-associated protein 3 FlgL|uniref:Flagellar hook-associated protein 3 n=1 Tax=Rheinheimera tangshanensis TaxID=400153 RepID=A0A5C8M260_9GAMM|nr:MULTISPECIES: flagellar hook-associated protein FlgL [Rheinheimera]KOO59848.1 flagellar hook-associated protein [Rheinheimera sp. KL1]TXK82089.1 flagellar hook-associated protein 3 [Rheinheimera tangshanensis]GGM51965.1 flagellar hook-associated protein 3 [Rheinheimera tangshanensis]
MRISSSQYHETAIRNIQTSSAKYSQLSVQMATNERITKPSDDPLGSVLVLRLDSELTSLEQYGKNMELVTYTLSQQETQLSSINNLLLSVQSLVTAAADASYGEDELKAMANELAVLMPGIADLLNAKDGNGNHLFAGSEIDQQPFIKDVTGQYIYQGDSLVRKVAVSSNTLVDANIVGSDLVPGATFLNDLQDYVALLQAPPAAGVGTESRAMLDKLSATLGNTTAAITKIGGIVSSLESLEFTNTDIALFTENLRDDLTAVHYPSAYIEMNNALASYESTLKVYSSVSQLSLFSQL